MRFIIIRSTYFKSTLPSNLLIPQGCEDGSVAILDKRALSVPVSVQVDDSPVRCIVLISRKIAVLARDDKVLALSRWNR